MDFFVYSRPAIERVPPHDVPHVVISITTTPNDRARIPRSEHCRGVLRLVFPDADRAVDGTPRTSCSRGITPTKCGTSCCAIEPRSRGWSCTATQASPAVAAALSKALTGVDAEFFGRYRPNMRVYRILLDRYHERFGEGSGPD